MSAPAAPLRATTAQAAMELRLTARRGENLLAVAVIPTVVLVFFSSTGLLTTPGMRPVDFLVPGSIALAIIATGLVNLGIATAYERSYGVLKRLGGSPLGRPGLIAAKLVAVGAIVGLQVVLLATVATVVLDWRPGEGWSPFLVLAALVLGSVAFAGLGLLLAGSLRAEATLALANGLFIAGMLVGGVIVPVSHLPAPLAALAAILPAAALSDALRMSLGGGGAAGTAGAAGAALGPWLVLAAWAIGSVVLAARTFRWD